jgi:hypothetical protein
MTTSEMQAAAAKQMPTIYQSIFLDERACIVTSSDNLFITAFLKEIPATVWCPFVESIFHSLLQLRINNDELYFSCVKNPCVFLYGFFDFYFIGATINNSPMLLWCISDRTADCTSARIIQQDYQDKIIAAQHAQLRGE